MASLRLSRWNVVRWRVTSQAKRWPNRCKNFIQYRQFETTEFVWNSVLTWI